MDGFIAKDEEVEQELLEELKRKKQLRKKSGKGRTREPEELDDEDLEVIKENIGIEIEKKKKSRLKRNADLENDDVTMVKQEKVEFEPDSVQIDTSTRPAVKDQSSASRVKHD